MQTRAEKEADLAELGKHFAETQVTVCADFQGLTVAQMTELRKELRKNGAVGCVVKNTISKLAFERAAEAAKEEKERFAALFKGTNFIVFSRQDPVTPAKVLAAYAKKNEKLKIKGGFLEGKFVDSAGVQQLAELPSREETLAKLLALLQTPATRLVGLLQAPAAQFVRCVAAIEKKLSEGGAAPAA